MGPLPRGGRGPFAILFNCVSDAAAEAIAWRGFGAFVFTPLVPPPRPNEGGSGGEPAGAGPPRHRPDDPGPDNELGATDTPVWSIPPGGRCATLTGITPPSTTPLVSPNLRLSLNRVLLYVGPLLQFNSCWLGPTLLLLVNTLLLLVGL